MENMVGCYFCKIINIMKIQTLNEYFIKELNSSNSTQKLNFHCHCPQTNYPIYFHIPQPQIIQFPKMTPNITSQIFNLTPLIHLYQTFSHQNIQQFPSPFTIQLISRHLYVPINCTNSISLIIPSIFLIEMKAIIVALFLISVAVSLPYVEQMLLSNSMIVGRDDQLDLVNWQCNVCDEANRPLRSHYIQEQAKDVKCILSVYPTFVVLAFRYTNTALNVWQDILYANQVADANVCSNCKVQKAYKNMWNTIVNNVTNDLKDINSQTKLKKLYITGISLGGGLAVISYIDILNSKIFETVQVITFAAPRVVNKNYAAVFDTLTNNRSKRFIIKGDPVVVLPECLTILCNYKHTGNQYVCIEDEQVCRGNLPVPENIFQRLQWKINADPSQKNLGSIVDHIYGYKKIYNFTVVEN